MLIKISYEITPTYKLQLLYYAHMLNFDCFRQVWLRMPRPPPAEMPESMRKRLEAEEAAKSK